MYKSLLTVIIVRGLTYTYAAIKLAYSCGDLCACVCRLYVVHCSIRVAGWYLAIVHKNADRYIVRHLNTKIKKDIYVCRHTFPVTYLCIGKS